MTRLIAVTAAALTLVAGAVQAQAPADTLAADVAAAIGDALTFGCVHADGVRLCLYQRQHPDTPTVPLDLQTRPSLAAVRPPPVDLMMYDQLLTGGTP